MNNQKKLIEKAKKSKLLDDDTRQDYILDKEKEFERVLKEETQETKKQIREVLLDIELVQIGILPNLG